MNCQADLLRFDCSVQGALENVLCSRLLFHVRAVNDTSLGTNVSRLSWSAAMLSTAPDMRSDGGDLADTNTVSDAFLHLPYNIDQLEYYQILLV